MVRSRLQLFVFLSLFVAAMFTVPPVASACTGMRVIAKDGSVAWARSMEFGSYIGSDMLVMPRGMALVSPAPEGKQGIQWTAKYGYVGPDGMGLNVPLEGMNEKGLYAGGFWMSPGETRFPDVAPADYPQSVAQTHLVSWLLSSFATLDEVKAALPKVKVAGLEVESLHAVALAHWYVMDATGKAAVIESIDGKVTIMDNPVGVFTNSPSFGWHLTHLRQYINLRPDNIDTAQLGSYKFTPLGEGSGLLGLPGDFTPPSRFVRAAIFVNSVLQPDDADGAVNVAMNLIAGFDITRGISKGMEDGKPKYDYTQWTTVYDMARKAVYFRTYEAQNYRVVHFAKLPLGGKKALSIHMGQDKGVYQDVSAQAK